MFPTYAIKIFFFPVRPNDLAFYQIIIMNKIVYIKMVPSFFLICTKVG